MAHNLLFEKPDEEVSEVGLVVLPGKELLGPSVVRVGSVPKVLDIEDGLRVWQPVLFQVVVDPTTRGSGTI